MHLNDRTPRLFLIIDLAAGHILRETYETHAAATKALEGLAAAYPTRTFEVFMKVGAAG